MKRYALRGSSRSSPCVRTLTPQARRLPLAQKRTSRTERSAYGSREASRRTGTLQKRVCKTIKRMRRAAIRIKRLPSSGEDSGYCSFSLRRAATRWVFVYCVLRVGGWGGGG